MLDGINHNLAIRNAGTFYFAGYTVNNGDWTSPQDNIRWQDDVKTLFDPCPSGWRVPKSGIGEHSIWSAFSADNGTWNGTVGQPESGYHYYGVSAQGSPWYPASGFYSPSADLIEVGRWIHNWSSTSEAGWSYSFRISSSVFTPNATNVHDHGFSVRCIRE